MGKNKSQKNEGKKWLGKKPENWERKKKNNFKKTGGKNNEKSKKKTGKMTQDREKLTRKLRKIEQYCRKNGPK